MKRAWVTRSGRVPPSWTVYVYDSTGHTSYCPNFPTHAAALAHALAETATDKKGQS